MNRFVLIDGNALVHRAYHALPPLTKNGEVVNAVYGFFSMLLKILEDVKPTFLAVTFDRPAPNFRQALFVGYQQHRPKMADDLSSQFILIHKILEKAGAQIFEVDGYEADDLIGTIAREAIEGKIENRKSKVGVEGRSSKMERKKIYPQSSNFKNPSSTIHHPSSNTEVIIVSGDRDLLQLVNHQVRMLAPVVGITNMVIFDSDKVKEKYGLKPSQIIDYKALVGDASDGYPGVTGIGPKTASDLLKKYETFESIYEHLGELSEKLSKTLATDAEQAALAKKLATIDVNVPIQFDIKKCSMKGFDTAKLKKEFERHGFSSLVKRLEQKGPEETLRQAQGKPFGSTQGRQKKVKQTLSDQLGLL